MLRPAQPTTAAVAVCLTVFLTAAVIFLLLFRLGDVAGARWAGWFAVLSAGATVVSIAIFCLLSPPAQFHRTEDASEG